MRTAIWWVDTCRICRLTVGPDGAASSFCEHTEQNTNSNKHASHLMSKQCFKLSHFLLSECISCQILNWTQKIQLICLPVAKHVNLWGLLLYSALYNGGMVEQNGQFCHNILRNGNIMHACSGAGSKEINSYMCTTLSTTLDRVSEL